MLVSAWLPRSDILSPAKTVAELRAARVCTAVLMCNDYSDSSAGWGPQSFRHWPLSELVAMADECRRAGIGVWLCSWVMPHNVFIKGACESMPKIAKATGASVVMWDAEEPWTHAQQLGPIERAGFESASASLDLRDAFAGTGIEMAVTAIGSASEQVWRLAKVCPIWVPQCYATTDSQATPGGVVSYSVEQWRKEYGEPKIGWTIGLAAYDQAPVPSVTMQPPIDDALALDMSTVCYWTLNAIAKSPAVTEFVAGLSRHRETETRSLHPGILPWVDIEAMPSSTVVRVVGQAQALLSWAGCDPGAIDGKPGPKTLAAVLAFQRREKLEPTGIVDAATWAELLRP
jgi:hypothetical protein